MDYALVLPIASLTSSHITRKLRLAGRVQTYDAQRGTLTLRDGITTDTLRVDVSLCLSPFVTYPWLQERNTVVVVIGYLESCEDDDSSGHSDDDYYAEGFKDSDSCASDNESEAPASLPMILRAILLKERSELDLKTWTQAIAESTEAYEASPKLQVSRTTTV